jgi:hypothetical protein
MENAERWWVMPAAPGTPVKVWFAWFDSYQRKGEPLRVLTELVDAIKGPKILTLEKYHQANGYKARVALADVCYTELEALTRLAQSIEGRRVEAQDAHMQLTEKKSIVDAHIQWVWK